MSRTLRMTLLAVAAALLLPGAAGAAAPSGVLADNAADGHIAAYGDVVAWNVRAGANVGYQLVVWQGGTTTTLPVTPSSEPFDVSAGRGPNGATWLVWTRCTGAATPSAPTLAGGCDVVRYDLSHPGERKVAGADTTIWNEHAPSIDGDHIDMVLSIEDAGSPHEPVTFRLSRVADQQAAKKTVHSDREGARTAR